MRISAIQAARLISCMLLLASLAFSPVASAQTASQPQPCPTGAAANGAAGAANTASDAKNTASSSANAGSAAKTGNTQQASSSADAAAQNAKAALQNLGSLFGKKKAQPAASAPPCPPTTATATPAAPSTAAPAAGAAAQPANSSAQPSAPNSAAPSTAAGGSAAPWSPDSGSTTGAAATAGSAAPFASAAPPDFSKLPDIGGALRIGLSHDEAQTAMLKMHPEYKVVPGPTGTLQPQPGRLNQLGGVRGQFLLDPGGRQVDQTFAFYTMPPTKQQAFVVARYYPYPQPGIDKLKLVAALRQKYGPETKAVYAWDRTKAGTGDVNINSMYWAYDEQGHVIASDKGSGGPLNPPFGCPVLGASTSGINIWVRMADDYRLNTLPPATFCDTIVLLAVDLGQGPYVFSTGTEIDDHVLLRRAVQIAGDAAKADAQKQHQQEIDQSKQAKPSL
jgi:hypothetical protein